MTDNQLLLGAHVSIAGGIYRAFERGARLGCRTIQIFLKNSNQWKAKELNEDDRLRFMEAQKRSAIGPVLAHDSYLINLASPNPELWRKSFDAFVEELNRANYLGVPYLVMHPGADIGEGGLAGIRRVSKALNYALRRVPPPVKILIENTAGQGSCLGSTFEQLAWIIEGIKSQERIGVCFDTCHAHAAGYDILTRETYLGTIDEFDRIVGIEKLCAFHVNDSKNEIGSLVDRHSHIGQGLIGLDPFRALINDRRFAHIPKIIETPKGRGIEEDLMNLATLRSLSV